MVRVKRIIPCLDIDGGRVVKNVQFHSDRWDAGDPAEVAARYDADGADEIVLLDISATHEGRQTSLAVISEAMRRVGVPITVGGGIGSVEHMATVLAAGASKVSISTAAVMQPDLIGEGAARFGSERIIVAIDARRRPQGGWEVYLHGGRTATGLDAIEWAVTAAQRGAGELLVTSMDTDGTRDGYDLELHRALAATVSVPVIASGGAGSLEHIAAVLTAGGADAALAASLFHSGAYTVEQVKQYLAKQGVAVRL